MERLLPATHSSDELYKFLKNLFNSSIIDVMIPTFK